MPDSARPTTSIYGERERPEHQSGKCIARDLPLDVAKLIETLLNAAPQILAALKERERMVEMLKALADESDAHTRSVHHGGRALVLSSLIANARAIIAQAEALNPTVTPPAEQLP